MFAMLRVPTAGFWVEPSHCVTNAAQLCAGWELSRISMTKNALKRRLLGWRQLSKPPRMRFIARTWKVMFAVGIAAQRRCMATRRWRWSENMFQCSVLPSAVERLTTCSKSCDEASPSTTSKPFGCGRMEGQLKFQFPFHRFATRPVW